MCIFKLYIKSILDAAHCFEQAAEVLTQKKKTKKAARAFGCAAKHELEAERPTRAAQLMVKSALLYQQLVSGFTHYEDSRSYRASMRTVDLTLTEVVWFVWPEMRLWRHIPLPSGDVVYGRSHSLHFSNLPITHVGGVFLQQISSTL